MRLPRLLLVCLLALAPACSGADAERPLAPIDVAWQAVRLDPPPGPDGRIAVRDAAACAGTWYAVGGVFGTGGQSRPAAWRSADAVTWTSVPLLPRGYWAERAVLSSVACRDDRVMLMGAKSGGAHGNPRVTTWYRRGDGTFVDALASFELYGGPKAVTVGRISAGPEHWLISGSRMTGGAVWVSDDDRDFRLVDSDPELSSDDTHDTLAIDQVHDGEQWTVVGSASRRGRVARLPMAWVSADGATWEREEVPETSAFNDLQRVVRHGDALLAVGLRGQAFGAWRRLEGAWSLGDSFGRLDPDGRGSPAVSGLTVAGAGGSAVLATVSDGLRYQLWAQARGAAWRPVETPGRPSTAGEHTMTVTALDDTVLLLADDGDIGGLWRTQWPTTR